MHKKTPHYAKRIGLIAGGTGITPCLRLMNAIRSNPNDRTQVSLIFGNVSVDDILLEPELRELANLPGGQFSVFFVVDRAPVDGRPWTGGVGFITADMIKAHASFPPAADTLFFMCGPRTFGAVGMVTSLRKL
jgi:cytochrome-b5 reductase